MPATDPLVENERGMALALAIFALAVLGALVASTAFAGLVEQQSGRNLLFATQAAEAADGGLWEGLLSTPASTLQALSAGGPPLVLAIGPSEMGSRVEGQVARLADNLFLVESRGVRQDGGGGSLAARVVGLLATLTSDSSGALTLVPLTQRAWLQLY